MEVKIGILTSFRMIDCRIVLLNYRTSPNVKDIDASVKSQLAEAIIDLGRVQEGATFPSMIITTRPSKTPLEMNKTIRTNTKNRTDSAKPPNATISETSNTRRQTNTTTPFPLLEVIVVYSDGFVVLDGSAD